MLEVTEAAIADELAGAADLIRHKDDGTPVVIIRGLPFDVDETATGRDLLRPAETDLFRRGRGGLTAALVENTPGFAGPVDQRDVWRVQAGIEAVCGSSVRIRSRRARDRRPGTELVVTAEASVTAGLAAGLLLALLLDLGYGAVLVEVSDAPTVWAGRLAAGDLTVQD